MQVTLFGNYRYWPVALVVGFCIAAMVGAACQHGNGHAALASGDVVRVVDVVKGDELLVENSGARARVRLLGVHAFDEVIEDPEVGKLAAASTAYLKSLLVGKDVVLMLSATPTDRYGRVLAYIDFNGADVGRDLVAAGFALVYTEFDFDRRDSFLGAELEARIGRRQLWSKPQLVRAAVGLRRQWHEGGAAAFTDPLLNQAEPQAPN